MPWQSTLPLIVVVAGVGMERVTIAFLFPGVADFQPLLALYHLYLVVSGLRVERKDFGIRSLRVKLGQQKHDSRLIVVVQV
jgi:hypothetical protein